MSEQLGPSNFQALFEAAFRDYEIQTGKTLANHPLVEKLQNCDSVESVTAVLREQTESSNEIRGKDRVFKPLKNILSVLHKLSSTSAVNSAQHLGLSFPPVTAIHTGLGILLSAVEGVLDDYDTLADLLETVEHFLNRFDIYTRIPPTIGMTEMIIKILVELLSILALATKQLQQGKLKALVKKLLLKGKEIEAVLQRLDRLTGDEARMTAAQTLQVVHGLFQNMKDVDDGKSSIKHVQDALEIIQQLASNMNKSNRDTMEQNIRRWLSPPDPWKNQNIACKSRHRGSAEWFLQGSTYSEWKASEAEGAILWVHGKPGAGKSVLCSTIIEDFNTMRKAGLASLAFFYNDFREDQKKDIRGLLSSLLVQLCHQSDSYSEILSKLYLEHANGSRYPSDNVLARCLKDLLKHSGHAPVYLIMDALDECPNTSSIPSPRAEVLNLIEELIHSQIPNLRICVTSRPETDIKDFLEPLVLYNVSLHDERGQKIDIKEYIKSVVNTNPQNKRWKAADKQLVIDILTTKANGMFRWVYCQLVYICGLIPARIRRALAELPDTLDETYERSLREINKAEWEIAHRLFQFVAVAVRPLRVEELAELLAFDFEAGLIPKFHEDWRLEDPVHAVLSTCSSLLSIVGVEGSPVIQFPHFSVKEFLTSARLAETRDIIPRRFYVSHIAAHTLAAQACLGILLHLDKDAVTSESLEKSPLVGYAAEYWADHARLDDVSRNVEDGMKQLFDPSKHHLTVCVWICDPCDPWRQFPPAGRLTHLSGTFLHYAALWGLRPIVEFLVIEHSQNVHSQDFTDGVTPLQLASQNGHVEVVCFFLEIGADVMARDKFGLTPLHYASINGHIEAVLVLIKHGADVRAQNESRRSPLHGASVNGHVGVVCILIEHGAVVSVQDQQGSTPLHNALLSENAEVARILIERGTDVTARAAGGWTPLHRASREGRLEAVRMLIERGADIVARTCTGQTPLHLAAEQGQLEVGRMLIERGVDMESQNSAGETSLHLAMRYGLFHFARMLIERGANVTRHAKTDWPPLKYASQFGDAEIVRMLIERGADVTAQYHKGRTPLHLASDNGLLEIVRIFIEHGVSVGAGDQDGSTPLHLASRNGHVEVVGVLLEHSADVTAQNKDGSTPLHLVSTQPSWSLVSPERFAEVARILLEHGADRTTQDENGCSPLDLASQDVRLAEVAQGILAHRTGAGEHENSN